MPKYRFKSVFDITVEDLQKMGAKAVGLDADNTICLDGTTEPVEGIREWTEKLLASGIKITVITNAVKPRARKIADALGLPYVYSAKKPLGFKLRRAARNMGVDITEMAMIGDQLFSDMKAANRSGAIAVRVDPLKGDFRYKGYYALRRRKEKPVMDEFEKNHGYGVYDNE